MRERQNWKRQSAHKDIWRPDGKSGNKIVGNTLQMRMVMVY